MVTFQVSIYKLWHDMVSTTSRSSLILECLQDDINCLSILNMWVIRFSHSEFFTCYGFYCNQCSHLVLWKILKIVGPIVSVLEYKMFSTSMSINSRIHIVSFEEWIEDSSIPRADQNLSIMWEAKRRIHYRKGILRHVWGFLAMWTKE